MSVWAIIPTAGTGSRFGGDVPKPLADLKGKSVITRTLLVFDQSLQIDGVIVVAHRDWLKDYETLIKRLKLAKVRAVVEGGETRTQSVRLGLSAVPLKARIVMVHDGVRPFLDEEMISRALVAVKETGAAVAGVRVKPTIKVVGLKDLLIKETLDRDFLWEIQTPQVFEHKVLKEAYDADTQGGTDDAALVERIGVKVKIFEGSYRNIKITTPEDMMIAQAFLGEK